MAESHRRSISLETIEKALPFVVKSHIHSFFGKIGTKDFKYGKQAFIDRTGQSKFPSFQANLSVLFRYMDRAHLAQTIALNLLFHKQVEETLAIAHQQPKSLPIPVKIQDPYGQWIEGTPLQIMLAAGDRNPPEIKTENINFGLAERLGANFENPVHVISSMLIGLGPMLAMLQQKPWHHTLRPSKLPVRQS